MGKYKALHVRNFRMRMTSTQIQTLSWEKMMLVHDIDITSKHEEGSNHVTGLGHWIC